MKFRCEIDMNGAAFADDRESELARLLEEIARHAARGQTGRGILDSNGNRVGQWVLEAEDDD